MDTRTDWDIALRHEDARVARYGRPAAVLAVRLRMLTTGAVDHYATRIGGAIRHQARETDRVTRFGPDRFHVLLPETLEAEASVLAERVRAACVADDPGRPGLGGGGDGRRGRDVRWRLAARGDAVGQGPAGELADQRLEEVLELARGIVGQPRVDIRWLDDRAGR